MIRGAWRPLVEDIDQRRVVRDALGDIARDLRARLGRIDRPRPAATGAEPATVIAQAALLFGYLGQALRRRDDTHFAWSLLDRAIELAASTPLPEALYGGFCDVGWTVQHLLRLAGATPRGMRRAFLDEIDRAARTALDGAPERLGYDLVHGLVGLAVYFVERLPRPAAVTALDRIVTVLHARSFRDRHGRGWRSRPEHLPRWQVALAPDGHYDFGMAHGTPGIIALLATLLGLGIAVEPAAEMLASAVPWLLAQRQPAAAGSRFAARKRRLDDPPANNRLAWCYGDPGPAIAVLHAGIAAGRTAWTRAGLRLARASAARAPAASGVLDATVCHGAAGLVHVYNRIAQTCGDDALRGVARAWLDLALTQRAAGDTVGGYAACCTTALGDEVAWRPDLGLLTGASGVGLVLLACITPTPPRWDRRLLLSFPAAR